MRVGESEYCSAPVEKEANKVYVRISLHYIIRVGCSFNNPRSRLARPTIHSFCTGFGGGRRPDLVCWLQICLLRLPFLRIGTRTLAPSAKIEMRTEILHIQSPTITSYTRMHTDTHTHSHKRENTHYMNGNRAPKPTNSIYSYTLIRTHASTPGTVVRTLLLGTRHPSASLVSSLRRTHRNFSHFSKTSAAVAVAVADDDTMWTHT